MAEIGNSGGRSTDAQASDVYKTARESLAGADSLAGTPWSKLFHEARTAGRRYSGVSLPVRVRDGSLDVGEPVKTRQGEHFRASESWDGVVSLPSKAFLDVRTARQQIRRQLRDRLKNAAVREDQPRAVNVA